MVTGLNISWRILHSKQRIPRSPMPNEHPAHCRQSLETTSKKNSLWRVRCRSTAWVGNAKGGEKPIMWFPEGECICSVHKRLYTVSGNFPLGHLHSKDTTWSWKNVHIIFVLVASLEGAPLFRGKGQFFWVLNSTFNPHSGEYLALKKWLKHW